MLSDRRMEGDPLVRSVDLNAPYGARCFLTATSKASLTPDSRDLNAPYGARCFLTQERNEGYRQGEGRILMHLMALGAF